MRALRTPLAAFCLVLAAAGLAAAQPTLSAVVHQRASRHPGHAHRHRHGRAQLRGDRQRRWGRDSRYAGVALAVGTNVSIVATGVIGGGGTAVVGFTPPFAGIARSTASTCRR